MSNEKDKILAVSRYLSHSDKNARAKALKKLESYLDRGYSKKLIFKQLKHYITIEKEISHVNYAKDMIKRYRSVDKGSGATIQISQKAFLMLIAGIVILIAIVMMIPSPDYLEDQLPKGYKRSKVKQKNDADVRTPFSLSKAQAIKLRPSKKFKVKKYKKKVQIKFKPKPKKVYRSSVKVYQQTNSNGRRIAKKSLKFLLTKKVLKSRSKATDVLMKISNPSGNISPRLMGFPKTGKELVFEIDKKFSVNKVKHVKQQKVETSNVYLFPFPLFSGSTIKSGTTWGTDISGEKFGVKSKYKFEGFTTYKKRRLFKISFVSVSRSNYDTTLFTVSRKGVFYVNASSGVPEYLKLYTISETKLKGSGFPVENIVIVEENLI